MRALKSNVRLGDGVSDPQPVGVGFDLLVYVRCIWHQWWVTISLSDVSWVLSVGCRELDVIDKYHPSFELVCWGYVIKDKTHGECLVDLPGIPEFRVDNRSDWLVDLCEVDLPRVFSKVGVCGGRVISGSERFLHGMFPCGMLLYGRVVSGWRCLITGLGRGRRIQSNLLQSFRAAWSFHVFLGSGETRGRSDDECGPGVRLVPHVRVHAA